MGNYELFRSMKIKRRFTQKREKCDVRIFLPLEFRSVTSFSTNNIKPTIVNFHIECVPVINKIENKQLLNVAFQNNYVCIYFKS